jgi:hypothetical protein
MPRGAAPGERRGGRAKGVPNRKTTERSLIAQKLARTLKAGENDERAQIAAMAIQAVRTGGTKLEKDKLQEYGDTLAGMAAFYQPRPPSQEPNKNENYERFVELLELAAWCAKEGAQYQSPKLRAVLVQGDAGMGSRSAEDNVLRMPAGDPVRAGRVYRMLIEGTAKKVG